MAGIHPLDIRWRCTLGVGEHLRRSPKIIKDRRVDISLLNKVKVPKRTNFLNEMGEILL